MSAGRDIKLADNLNGSRNEKLSKPGQEKALKDREISRNAPSEAVRAKPNPSQPQSNANNSRVAQQQQSNLLKNAKGPFGANVVPDSASASSGAAKIDSDLVNVANENRVILNVGGIRHETYKVSKH